MIPRRTVIRDVVSVTRHTDQEGLLDVIVVDHFIEPWWMRAAVRIRWTFRRIFRW